MVMVTLVSCVVEKRGGRDQVTTAETGGQTGIGRGGIKSCFRPSVVPPRNLPIESRYSTTAAGNVTVAASPPSGSALK